MPFAGVAFLWFVGVLRDRIGAAEDRFFATLFLGSGLLFIAMLFVSAAIAAALVESFGDGGENIANSTAWTISRHACYELMQGGLQMLGVFTVATSTILLRTAVGPRWLAFFGYAIAALLLVAVYFFAWVALLFPIWVLVLSLEILVADFRRTRVAPADCPLKSRWRTFVKAAGAVRSTDPAIVESALTALGAGGGGSPRSPMPPARWPWSSTASCC